MPDDCSRKRVTLLVGLSLNFILGGCARPARLQEAPSLFLPSLVALSVPQIEPALAWYRDTLGFTLERRSEFPDYHLRMAWLVRGRLRLELVELEGSRSRTEVLPSGDNPALIQGLGKIGFEVANAAAYADELKRKGVRFQIELRDDPGSHTRAFIVLDNNGNWLQFFQVLR